MLGAKLEREYFWMCMNKSYPNSVVKTLYTVWRPVETHMQAQQVLSIRVCDIDLNAMFCVHYVGNKFKEALIEVGTKITVSFTSNAYTMGYVD